MSKELINTVDNKLNAALVENGVPILSPQTDYDKYINISMEDLRKIKGDEAIEIAIMLEQCSCNIQAKSNRLCARLMYVKNELNKALGRVYNTYDTYGGYDIVLGKACVEHEPIEELNKLKLSVESELEDLKYLGRHVANMADMMRQLKWRK